MYLQWNRGSRQTIWALMQFSSSLWSAESTKVLPQDKTSSVYFGVYLDKLERTAVVTFSLKFLLAAARARTDVAALLTRWLSSSCKIPRSRKVCGRGWSLFSRFPFNFLRVFSRPGHCSSSISITASERIQLHQLTNEDVIKRRQSPLWFTLL